MADVDDYDELIATRRLHGLNDNLFKEEIDIEELKEALTLWEIKWKEQRNRTVNRDERIKLTSLIYLARWIINSKKGFAIDITKILREETMEDYLE